MKPKKKAEELLKEFFPNLKESLCLGLIGVRKKYAKKCAITAIDLVLTTDLYSQDRYYWTEVRVEIEEL